MSLIYVQIGLIGNILPLYASRLVTAMYSLHLLYE